MHIGLSIKCARIAKNISIAELAKKLSVPPARVYEVEDDKVTPTLEFFTKISEVLGINFLELMWMAEQTEIMKANNYGNEKIYQMLLLYAIQFYLGATISSDKTYLEFSDTKKD